MPSFDEKIGEPKKIEKPYTDIIRSDVKVEREYVEDPGLPIKIVYYDKAEKKLVKTPRRIGKKLQFKNPDTNEILAFGSERSVANYYRVPELRAETTSKKRPLDD